MLQSRRLTGGSGRLGLEPPHASAPHFKPSTSSKHGLPKFCGCQWSVDRWRRRAHRASRDARRSTGYARAIDGLKTSEGRGFHKVDGALCRAAAGYANAEPGEAPPHNQRVSREGRRPKTVAVIETIAVIPNAGFSSSLRPVPTITAQASMTHCLAPRLAQSRTRGLAQPAQSRSRWSWHGVSG